MTQYDPGNKVRCLGRRVPGRAYGEVFDPAEAGWKIANVRAMINQGVLEVYEQLGEPEYDFYRVAGSGGKYFVVKGQIHSDLLSKDGADKLILEMRNERSSDQQNTG